MNVKQFISDIGQQCFFVIVAVKSDHGKNGISNVSKFQQDNLGVIDKRRRSERRM